MTYMDKEEIWHCPKCSLDINNLGYHMDTCPYCGGEELYVAERNLQKFYTRETVQEYINNAISKADGYIQSKFPCFMCDGKHYMVWPGVRSHDTYSEVEPLLSLPQCPIRVWRGADKRGIGMKLEDFLRSLEVNNG